ncbi:MAG TPA: Ig-like domain-containing protein [Candidatus Acidoferrum sp.]|nr:Ig-like domain-containing protein [Candidatus Acidoferrum sp.]
MSSMKSNFRLIAAFAALASLALAVSCRGFFVKPTVSSLVVAPATPSIQTGSTNNTVQMSAVATFNDGSTGSTPVSWSISDQSVATISAGGLVKSVATGTATITATSTQNPTITGTQSLTVTVGCIQSISVSPTSASISVSVAPTTQQFTATANTCTGAVPITDVASWISSNTAAATIAGGGLATAVAPGTTTITASSGGVTSGTNGGVNATLTVGP